MITAMVAPVETGALLLAFGHPAQLDILLRRVVRGLRFLRRAGKPNCTRRRYAARHASTQTGVCRLYITVRESSAWTTQRANRHHIYSNFRMRGRPLGRHVVQFSATSPTSAQRSLQTNRS